VSTALRFAIRNTTRTPARTVIRVLVLSVSVALLAAMLLFVGHSLTTMTATAVRSVPLDWQGPVTTQSEAVKLAAATARQPGIAAASPAATAPFAGASHNAPTGLVNSSNGSILAVPPGYPAHFHTMRFLHGDLKPGQVVLDQQLAATLQAGVGDQIGITAAPHIAPQRFTVSGVALVTAPDVLFQPLNPLLGPAPAQPPAEIVVMPLQTFSTRMAPAYRGQPGGSSSLSSVVPGAQTGIQWQVQAQVAPSALTGSPAHATTQATQIKNRVERTLLGRVQFVDNLGDMLTNASGDALYAETLYIMLALPGALIALGLAYLAALGTVDRDRRDLSLLRARGATRRNLLTMAAFESVLIGGLAGVLGAVIGIGAYRWWFGGVSLSLSRALGVGAACLLLAIVGAAAARIGTSIEVMRTTINQGRRIAHRDRKPLWQRLWLDVLAIVVSGAIYWLTVSTGFSAVVNPDSNPTLSLSVYMFFAPALLWVGAALLLVRLRGRVLGWLAGRAGGTRSTTRSGLVLSSAARRGAAINRGLVLVGLLLAFGGNLGIFTATYDQQAMVDAQLTLGADVAVTAPPGAASSGHLMDTVGSTPGVSSTTALDHAYAYVGPDLQDTFGINPGTFTDATTLRDSYFLGSSASQAIDALKHTPDGILVSKETITDYQLNVGDLLRLRVLDQATGRFHVAPFHVVGIVQEFPSAPKDSFMVTNLAYLERVTHGTGPNVVFAKTSAPPAAVAARIAPKVAPLGATVSNIDSQVRATTSSITTVDLNGISHIEEAFAIVLAAAAIGLYVAVAVVERRHEFAAMAAVGATIRDIGAYLWSEAVIVLGASLLLAVVLGWMLSLMMVAMLQHVFDPPPDTMSVPWRFLLELGAVSLGACAVAVTVALRSLGRLQLGAILREQ
jgi:putative ABC transport system permease protein